MLSLLHLLRSELAHRDEQVRLEFSVGIGGAADLDGRAGRPKTGANDPNRLLRDFVAVRQMPSVAIQAPIPASHALTAQLLRLQ